MSNLYHKNATNFCRYSWIAAPTNFFEIELTSALLYKGADLKRNDCVTIYAFWSLRCGVGRGGREALASTDALTLCPHTREHCFTFYRPYIRDSRI